MAQKASLVYGAVLLFIYSLGRGVPILLAGTFTGALKGLHSFGKWSEWLEKASGVLILLVGFYFYGSHNRIKPRQGNAMHRDSPGDSVKCRDNDL
jgi:thiol:disulfide interchange protein